MAPVFLIGGGRDEEAVRASHAPTTALVVSPERPPQAADLAGGWTPGYQEVLVTAETDWLPRGVPYAGFSAGAAVAGRQAIVGGWRTGGVAISWPATARRASRASARRGASSARRTARRPSPSCAPEPQGGAALTTAPPR